MGRDLRVELTKVLEIYFCPRTETFLKPDGIKFVHASILVLYEAIFVEPLFIRIHVTVQKTYKTMWNSYV